MWVTTGGVWVTEGGVWVTKGVCFYPYPIFILTYNDIIRTLYRTICPTEHKTAENTHAAKKCRKRSNNTNPH